MAKKAVKKKPVKKPVKKLARLRMKPTEFWFWLDTDPYSYDSLHGTVWVYASKPARMTPTKQYNRPVAYQVLGSRATLPPVFSMCQSGAFKAGLKFPYRKLVKGTMSFSRR